MVSVAEKLSDDEKSSARHKSARPSLDYEKFDLV